ncbi:Hypothetical predicted protein [Mytilus galloprovincialis]|uniref:Uncharacterized protein n=1 Tax=Mytilus galloprovincialis TaxID=29158 RepID=A0A8B6ES37_MYTGA|nr:Hypothetical predicted protein [Mytilus galloprovincialis]
MSNKHHRLSSLSIFQRHITTSSIKLENAGSYYTSESEPVIPSFANQEKRLTIFPNSYRNVPNQRVDQVINHNTINLPTSRHITISLSERENGLDIHIQKHVSNTIRNATDANLSQHINTYKSLLDQSSRKMAMVALFYFAVYNLYIKCFLYLILKIKLSGMKKNWDSINRLQTSAEIEESSKNSILTTRGLETTYVKAISRRMEHICDHQIFSARHCEIVSKDIVFVDKTPKECLRKTKAINNELGLKKYFERISSGTPVTTVDSMSNELLRLSSFSNFPSDINISLIKLAKTGFYYSGRRNTKCFSCGVTYDKWKSVDDPAVIHKMLSPSCALVAETRFSSSANQEERTTVVSNNTDSTVDTRTVTSHGLNQSENASSTYEPRLQISSSYNGTSNNVQERQGNQQSLLSNRNRSSSVTGNSQETQTSKENKNATGTSSCQHNTEFESLGMHLEKPKYPNYACLNVRISSFEGWPSYLDQSPRQMALAGFLFAGYHDYTRCFFCGGGLRNWEAGDDPWVEHARWFPKCTFLKQNKGEKFINAVQKRQEEIDRETNATNTQETTPRAQTSSLAINNSTTSTTQSDILQTFAARSVIEMGFPYQQVINAFKYLTTSGKDIQSISVTDVMYILLDDEGHPQQQGATADVTQHASDTNNAGGHRSGSTNTECNGIDNTGYEQNSLCCFDCARIMRTCLVFMKYFKEFVK